jgi:uncharacterized membrane protein
MFGLSLSQLPLLLDLPPRASDLITQPVRYIVFFGSFAIVCTFWYSHHRMFRYFYPGRIDVLVNFLYLAFAVLVPFGMQTMIKFPDDPIAFGVYVASFIGTSSTMFVLLVRGLRRNVSHIAEPESLELYRRAVRMACICVVMVLALGLLHFGLQYAANSLWLLPPGLFFARILVRRVPTGILTSFSLVKKA